MSGFSLLALEGVAPWLQRRDPRLRLVAAGLFAVVAVTLTTLPALLAAFGLALVVAWRAGFGPVSLARRLLMFEGFMLLLLIFLPFSVPGETLWDWGSLAISREGLVQALSILLKASAIVVMLTTLVGTLEPVALGHALAHLGIPDKLVHLLLFTVRYLAVLHEELQRLRLSLRTRAFTPGPNRHTWRTFGWLVGMLLVRSLDRSHRIHAAMVCRGFNGRLHVIDNSAWQSADSIALGIVVGALGLLPFMDHLA